MILTNNEKGKSMRSNRLYARSIRQLLLLTLTTSAVLIAANVAVAQLQITELMINPIDDQAWEWIEVRNTSGSDIDLDGYFADRLGDSDIPDTGNPNIQSSVAENTLVPANGVAVLYDGFAGSGSPATHNDSFFRDAWGLSSSVPLVSVDFFPALANAGTAIGFWENRTNYDADLIDPDLGGAACGDPGAANNTCIVGSFDNAAFSIDYNGFPITEPQSATWTGNGSNQNAANWVLSENGVNGAVTSTQVIIPGGGADIANPGLVAGGTAPAGVTISEVMFNSGLDEPDWEWVEIFNNTGSTIDFSSTPFVLDDDDGAPLEGANITSGSVANGSPAVLFNADALSLSDFQDAWDPGGTNGTTFIEVTNWPAFGNSGDVVAVWDDFADYNSESEPGDTQDNAASVVAYDGASDVPEDWPGSNNGTSITLRDLGNDPNSGLSWDQSFDGDLVGSFQIQIDTVFHPGGDIGSPGTFSVAAGVDGDFDSDGDVDGNDFLAWQRGESPDPLSAGDLALWEDNFGTTAAQVAASTIPEPSSLLLLSLALVPLAVRRQD